MGTLPLPKGRKAVPKKQLLTCGGLQKIHVFQLISYILLLIKFTLGGQGEIRAGSRWSRLAGPGLPRWCSSLKLAGHHASSLGHGTGCQA